MGKCSPLFRCKSNPNLADAYVGRGYAKESLGDYRGALQDYSKAIELDPNNTDAYYNRGNVKDSLQDYRGLYKTSIRQLS